MLAYFLAFFGVYFWLCVVMLAAGSSNQATGRQMLEMFAAMLPVALVITLLFVM